MKRDKEKGRLYMQKYRERKPRSPRPKKRQALDRSRPPLELMYTDPHAYQRQYIRWWRDMKKRGEPLPERPKHQPKRYAPRKPDGLNREKPQPELFSKDRTAYQRQYHRWWRKQRKDVKNNGQKT
jgi:hypothetical protein